MPKIKIWYGKNAFDITEDNKIEGSLEKYKKIIQEEDILFLYKGMNIIENKDILNKIKKNKNIIITVIKKNKKKIENDIGNIICPECQQLVFLILMKKILLK